MTMAMNRKLCFNVVVLSVLVLCAGLALATKDPELKECKHQCRVQQQYDEKQKEQCAKECERYYKEKKQRERERHGVSEEEGEEERGGGGEWMNTGDQAEKHLKECQRRCEGHRGGQEKALCRFRCQEEYRREKREGGGGGGGGHNVRESEQEEDEKLQRHDEEEEEEENPYVFEKHDFESKFSSENGRIHVLPKFTQRSKLLRGLEKYRLAIMVANPQTFVTPTHVDADSVLFVSWGNFLFE